MRPPALQTAHGQHTDKPLAQKDAVERKDPGVHPTVSRLGPWRPPLHFEKHRINLMRVGEGVNVDIRQHPAQEFKVIIQINVRRWVNAGVAATIYEKETAAPQVFGQIALFG